MKKKMILICMVLFILGLNIVVMAGEYRREPDASLALDILKYSARMIDIDESDLYWLDQDYNTVVDAEDALIILQKAAKIYSPCFWNERLDEIPDGAKDIEAQTLELYKGVNRKESGIYFARSFADYHAITATNNELQLQSNLNEDYFKEHSFIIVDTNKGSDDCELTVNGVFRDGDKLIVSYSIHQPEIPSLGLVSHLILIQVDNEMINGVNSIAEHITWNYDN